MAQSGSLTPGSGQAFRRGSINARTSMIDATLRARPVRAFWVMVPSIRSSEILEENWEAGSSGASRRVDPGWAGAGAGGEGAT